MNNVERDYENIFLVLLAVLKAKGCDYVHIPQLKKVVLENVYAPVLKNHLVGFPEDLTVFISDLEKCKYLTKKENMVNAYFISIPSEVVQKILDKYQKNPYLYKAIDSLASLYSNQDPVAAKDENFHKMFEIEKNRTIQTGEDFFIALCASLASLHIFILDDEVFKKAFHFSFSDPSKLNTWLKKNFEKDFEVTNVYSILYELFDISGITLKELDKMNLQDCPILKRLNDLTYAFEIGLNEEAVFRVLNSLSMEDRQIMNQISTKYQRVKQEYDLESEHPVLK